jgi:hypothetical protein
MQNQELGSERNSDSQHFQLQLLGSARWHQIDLEELNRTTFRPGHCARACEVVKCCLLRLSDVRLCMWSDLEPRLTPHGYHAKVLSFRKLFVNDRRLFANRHGDKQSRANKDAGPATLIGDPFITRMVPSAGPPGLGNFRLKNHECSPALS